MDIGVLGDLGDFIGGIAVIASIIYLATQVGQSNRLAQTQVHQEASRMSTELGRSLDREKLELLSRVANDPDSLDLVDMRLARTVFLQGVNYYEALFYAFERGHVDPEFWNGRKYRMAVFLQPAQEHLWKPMRLAVGDRFRTFVEEEVLPSHTDAMSPIAFPEPSD